MSSQPENHGPVYRHVDEYVGPSTGKGPIYDGRFSMKERKSLAEENLKL